MDKINIDIGFYGSKGSFSEEGALTCINNFSRLSAEKPNINLISCGKDVMAVFSKVEQGEADFGVVPIENSSAGIITNTIDLLLREKIYVVGEGINRIEQHLISNKGVTIDQVNDIYSHNAALYQCTRFLRSRDWNLHSFGDTATAVKKIKDENLMDAAAIAGKRAAIVYDMDIIRNNIEDHVNNFTRFFMISRKRCAVEDADKTSIAIELRDGLNSLAPYLNLFVENNIELLNIQSRPSKNRIFEYMVYIDFSGTLNDEKVKAILPELVQKIGDFRLLGSYRKAVVDQLSAANLDQ
ncbi:MAG: hypothetical protein STSR0001_14140 [Methanothrix sp.]